MGFVEEIRHFLEKEIEITERRLKDEPENPFYDGVHVGEFESKKLKKNHILFCKQIMRMIEDGARM